MPKIPKICKDIYFTIQEQVRQWLSRKHSRTIIFTSDNRTIASTKSTLYVIDGEVGGFFEENDEDYDIIAPPLMGYWKAHLAFNFDN